MFINLQHIPAMEKQNTRFISQHGGWHTFAETGLHARWGWCILRIKMGDSCRQVAFLQWVAAHGARGAICTLNARFICLCAVAASLDLQDPRCQASSWVKTQGRPFLVNFNAGLLMQIYYGVSFLMQTLRPS